MVSNLIKRWQVTWKPEVFQGWGRSNNYFEGWYFKVVTAKQDRALAFIPGVSQNARDPHAFLQVMDGTLAKTDYHRYPVSDFRPAFDKFELQLGDHRFGLEGLRMVHPDIHGSLTFSQTTPWKGSAMRPGIMGWYSFVPFMQCYHGLVSINHTLHGSLMVQGEEVDFSGGKGYTEKDWGTSFPKAWIWTQCNHYTDHDKLSVMASVAHIPWLGTYFVGFLALIWHGSQIKIFTTYTGAEMKAMLAEDQVTLRFRDKEEQLTIRAKMAPGVDLVSPQVGEMVGKINESLQATHEIEYVKDQKVIVEAEGSSAGLEISEGHEILLSEKWRK